MPASPSDSSQRLAQIKALTFDVFGTAVDWRGSIAREGEEFGAKRGWTADWERFADAWRAGYRPGMKDVRTGKLPWMSIDALHRRILNQVLRDFRAPALAEVDIDHLNRAWHRLAPWPDTLAGLARLKSRYVIATLSNGNIALLTNMAKHAGLPWDCILSAELFVRYKPDPETYRGAARLLGVGIEQMMMVAAHPDDLRAARALGCRTAFVKRPLEYGPGRALPPFNDGEFDIVADDFIDLARQLITALEQ
ncbi:MAG: haloacid dehalogenase type II [Burkholderiales bacterium]|nr:haloacid dehalogenase type II [Burkholderiales bacterium]MDQ3195510.1 haloacid dehalogenase type II [Pseudomonadota bacterium]